MYRATTSFTTKDYDIKYKQILDDNFTTQDEIQEFLNVGYIEVYDGSLEITQNGVYDVKEYDTADVNVSGGSTPVLENKSISITSNGSYSVTYDDENYDGLDDVAITVNVTGVNDYSVDYSSGIGINFVIESKITGYNYAKTIKNNWDSSLTSINSKYQSDTNLVYFPLVDMSNVTDSSKCFRYCINLEAMPFLDTSTFLYANYLFDGCTKLKYIPQFDFSSATAFGNAFKNCSSLTDESLNNILGICINAVAYKQAQPSTNLTLKTIGLSSSQATRCQTLSNYQAFINAGWITGY